MKAFLLLGLLLLSGASIFAADPLPAPWKSEDIGAVETPGTATVENGVFTLQGTMDLWGTADGCHTVWQPLPGDGEIIARVTSVENTASHAKGAVCIRESTAPGARHATLAVTPADGTQFLSREQIDGKTTSQVTGKDKGRFPCWLKLVRHGKEFSGYESGDGETWTLVGKIELDFGADAVAGLCASSHVKTTLCKAVFDQVKVTSHPDAVK
jgi:hypothetical protein